jgi:tungstate transport system permease protein
MHDFAQAFITAIALAGSFDPEIVTIVALSLRVSLSASIIAAMIATAFLLADWAERSRR